MAGAMIVLLGALYAFTFAMAKLNNKVLADVPCLRHLRGIEPQCIYISVGAQFKRLLAGRDRHDVDWLSFGTTGDLEVIGRDSTKLPIKAGLTARKREDRV